MQPLYFTPLDGTGNFIGTNPLGTAGVPIKTTIYPYFNPSIYQSFTFYSFPIQNINGTYYTIQPVTYSVRFGTETQPIYGSNEQLQIGILLGSSSFVNIMGSNVYTGLIDATNSIIIYQNEQVSSYYSQSLSYQVNIANLTAALNSVSTGSGSQESGNGTIMVTTFSWNWYTTAQGYTGSQVTGFQGYTVPMTVNTYLSVTYGGTVITNSSVAVTQIQSLITVQNNDLANSQTFMNNAVTTLQSQVSLAGQIIGTLSSIMQSIISNIGNT